MIHNKNFASTLYLTNLTIHEPVEFCIIHDAVSVCLSVCLFLSLFIYAFIQGAMSSHHLKLLTSRMRIICFMFYLLYSKLKSVWYCYNSFLQKFENGILTRSQIRRFQCLGINLRTASYSY